MTYRLGVFGARLLFDRANIIISAIGGDRVGSVGGGGLWLRERFWFSSNAQKLFLFEDIPEKRGEVRVVRLGVLLEVSYVVVTFLELFGNAREERSVMQALFHLSGGR